jgi:prepilin-type N-terminal cleavage/methylation domain-containing protein
MKIFNKKEYLNRQQGFTLVETLVAVTILVIASLGPIAIAAQGISSATAAKDQITAYYLAQEGIEYVRYVRDSNAIRVGKLGEEMSTNPNDSTYWLDGLTSCEGANGCYFSSPLLLESNPPEASSCSTTCPNLYVNNGYYVVGSSGTRTSFRRTMKIFDGDYENQKIVEVTMNWTTKNVPKNFVLREIIFNAY